MGIDVITLALARKYTNSKISEIVSGNISSDQLSDAISSYFDKNPDSVVTNDELESVLEDYQTEIIAGKNIIIDSDKKTINANFTLSEEEKQSIADLHKDKVSSINGETGDVIIDIASLEEKIKMLEEQIVSLQESISFGNLTIEVQNESESVTEAIANLSEGQAIKLIANQTISENLTITKDCYIDANGSTFTGTVTIPTGANVTIKNATFSSPVVMV